MTEWIDIQDRLPEINKGVLVTDGDIVTAAERVNSGSSKRLWWSGHEFGGYEWDFDFDEDAIIHWMPLPNPPKDLNSSPGGD